MRLLCHLALWALASAACTTAPPRVPSKVWHAPPARPSPIDAPAAARYRTHVLAANEDLRQGDLVNALTQADLALHLQPFGLEASLAKVETHLALGQRTLALDFAERLRDRHPGRVEARYALGKAFYALGRLSASRDAFADALALAPNDRPSLLGLLTTLAHDPDVPFSELSARADELMNGSPDDADPVHALGMASEIRGDLVLADALYLRAIALRKLHPFAHYNLARLRRSQSGMPSARPYFLTFLDQATLAMAREVAEVQQLLETPHE